MIKFHYRIILKVWLLAATLSGMTCDGTGQSETEKYKGLKLNEIQLIGSHNSYKPGIDTALYAILYKMDSVRAAALQYGHIPLSAQLDLGLRNLELDVVHDPEGGRYSKPLGLQWLRQSGAVAEPYDTAGDLYKPGLKVIHVPDLDFRSHHLLFTDCLKELLQWSKSNPGHLPVVVTINAKDGNEKGLIPLFPFTRQALDSIDMELRLIFNDENLITPDFIRGSFPSVADAVLTQGWPDLGKLSGRFLFVLDETGQKLEDYRSGHPGLKGRVMFVNGKNGDPDAAVMIINDPIKDKEYIKSMVKKNYLVRTRADANTVEARMNTYDRFTAAMESGAQIITTDYYLPSAFFSSPFKVVFQEGGFVRKNPVTLNPK